jgi:hypothetical protein
MWFLATDTIYYYENDKKNYGSYSHFQEDSNIPKWIVQILYEQVMNL